MKEIFDKVSQDCSKIVIKEYSTSFYRATELLSKSIRNDIFNIYGFVRFADEIVDTFHDYPKKQLLDEFEKELWLSIENKISLNPILNSFQYTVNKYDIDLSLIKSFMKSMRMDLDIRRYKNIKDYKEYIYGSADVIGLMCLKVFVKGDQQKYDELKNDAMKLGSAFQKVNFLRDLKADFEDLSRSYFPNTNLEQLDETSKQKIIQEIEEDFAQALRGIAKLPVEAKLGVYTAYVYFSKLLKKLKAVPSLEIRKRRVRVPNYQKAGLLAQCYVSCRLNLI